MSVDVVRVAGLIRETAEIEILPRFRQLAAGDIREKGPGDLVTVADEAAERRLGPLLRDILPGSNVVGEEQAAAEPGVVRALGRPGDVWVIDPVDGTMNFTQGRDRFAVIVALVRGGTTMAAWIHDPVTGRMAIAEQGAGAWIGDHRLATQPTGPTPRSWSGGLGLGGLDADQRRRIRTLSGPIGRTYGVSCAGHDYLDLAEGRTQFVLFHRIKPWDHLAGALIVEEAGGHVRRHDGSLYLPNSEAGGLLAASDRATWDHVSGLLLKPAS
jgi:fructose-1,6-bisphosphatase/inositol monophosphatase family enzyme